MRFRLAILGAAFVLSACGDDNPTGPDCVVSSVTVTGAPATLAVGGTANLAATVAQENCTGLAVTWSSSNTNLLTVNGSGVVTGVAAGGPVTITAATGGKTGTAQITVIAAAVNTVTLAPDSIVLAPGGTFLLTGTTRDAANNILAGRAIAWTTGAAGTATVANGTVTAVAAGNTTITGTSETKSGTAKVFVVAPRMAFFWNDQQAPGGGAVPEAQYRLSTNPATVFGVSQANVGQYSVSYSNMARAGAGTEAVFVSAYNSGSAFCNVANWGSESSSLRCWAADGSPANSQFNVLSLGSAVLGGRSAYAWSSSADATSAFDADPGYRYSSSNRPITITRTGAGIYSVVFVGQGRTAVSDREALMVNAYGAAAVECHSGGWNTVGSDLTATVYCFNAAGTATNSNFVIGLVSAPRTGARIAFVDADQPANTVAYTPTNSKVLPTGTATVTRLGAGRYMLDLDGFARTAGVIETFQVSAVGTTPVRCAVEGWGYGNPVTTVWVRCTNPAGTLVDSRFTLVGLQ